MTAAPAVESRELGYWERMSPEERKAEMKRRRAKGQGRRCTKPAKGKRFKCKQCNKRFPTAPELGNHVRYAHPKGKANGSKKAQAPQLDAHVSYLFGRCEVEIEHYANSNGLSKSALAEGVAALLRR